MGKMMISLSKEAEILVRRHIRDAYHDRVGALSIFFEQLVRDHFARQKELTIAPAT
jgi:hypothetical protein